MSEIKALPSVSLKAVEYVKGTLSRIPGAQQVRTSDQLAQLVDQNPELKQAVELVLSGSESREPLYLAVLRIQQEAHPNKVRMEILPKDVEGFANKLSETMEAKQWSEFDQKNITPEQVASLTNNILLLKAYCNTAIYRGHLNEPRPAMLFYEQAIALLRERRAVQHTQRPVLLSRLELECD